MPTDYHTLSADELLTALEQAGRTPPLDLIRACLDRQTELTPGLLAMLADEPGDDWADDDPRWYAQIHAGHLLIAYRELAALPIFAKLFRDEETEESMMEWFGSDIAAFGPPATDVALSLLADPTVSQWTRIGMTETLMQIARRHPSERERIVGGLRAQLPPLTGDGQLVLTAKEHEKPSDLWSWALYALAELGDTGSAQQGEALYAADVIDEMVMGDVQNYLAILSGDAEPSPQRDRTFDIIETYQGLHQQAARDKEWRAKAAQLPKPTPLPVLPTALPPVQQRDFDYQQPYVRPTPKVGRNDPCPCGSGKKYKKCHGANG